MKKIEDYVEPQQLKLVPKKVREAFIRYLATDPPPAQVMEFVGFYFDKKSHERDYDRDTGRKAFIERCGGDVKMAERKAENVRRALNQEHIDDALIELIEASGIGNDPEFLLHLDTVGAALALQENESQQDEERLKQAEEASKAIEAEANTPQAQAQARIDAIRADKNHPYHSGNQKALDEMASLYAIARGTQVHYDSAAPVVIPGVPQEEPPYESDRPSDSLKGVDVAVGGSPWEREE